jgi:hypothetical protein
MKRCLAILLLVAAALPGAAQYRAGVEGRAKVSRSGQFEVYDEDRTAPHLAVPEVITNPALTPLEASTLTVSCERIKNALLNALTTKDQWSGKISIQLQPARSADDEIVVNATRYADGWKYQVELPDAVPAQKLIRAITQVLLVEMANRKAGDQSAALPAWLAEGMPEYLHATSDVELILQPATMPTRAGMISRPQTRDGRHTDPFKRAREQLKKEVTLTLDELGQPAPGQLEGEAGEYYHASAMLFVHGLLQTKNGGANLAAMLPELAWDADWRVGFLHAFHSQFPRAIDAEKWWALQSVFSNTHASSRNWPRDESLGKLNEILRTTIEVQVATNEPPLQTDVSLQSIIKGWELERQLAALREKDTQLQALQLRSAPELNPLLQQYREVIAGYLKKMDTSEAARSAQDTTPRRPASQKKKKTGIPATTDKTVKEALAQLDVLDQRRDTWRTAAEEPPATPAEPPAQ